MNCVRCGRNMIGGSRNGHPIWHCACGFAMGRHKRYEGRVAIDAAEGSDKCMVVLIGSGWLVVGPKETAGQ